MPQKEVLGLNQEVDHAIPPYPVLLFSLLSFGLVGGRVGGLAGFFFQPITLSILYFPYICFFTFN